MQLQWCCKGIGCQPLVGMRHLNQLPQVCMIHLHILCNIDHIDFQCQFFFLKDIPGLSIFVSSVKEERKNGALKVVDFAIFSLFQKIESYQSDILVLLTIYTIWSGVGVFAGILIIFPNFLNMSDLIEYGSILLNIVSEKCSCLREMWWREPCCVFLLVVDFR